MADLKPKLEGPLGIKSVTWRAKPRSEQQIDEVRWEFQRRRSGRFRLAEVLNFLSKNTGKTPEYFVESFVTAIAERAIPLRNPRDYSDVMPYPNLGMDVPGTLRAYYDCVDAGDVNRWLDTHPEWHVGIRFARRRSEAPIAVTPPAPVVRPEDSVAYMSLDAACKELEARVGVVVSLTELLHHAAHAPVVVHWDTSSLHLEGQCHRPTDATGELSDVDDNPIEPVPPGIYEVHFLCGGASEFLLALANGKEWTQSAPTLFAPTDDSFFWELLEGNPEVPEWLRGEEDYLPSSEVPDLSELRLDSEALSRIEIRIKRLPRTKRNTSATISKPKTRQRGQVEPMSEVPTEANQKAPIRTQTRKGDKWTLAELQQLLKARDEPGMNAVKLATQYGVSPQRIRALLKQAKEKSEVRKTSPFPGAAGSSRKVKGSRY